MGGRKRKKRKKKKKKKEKKKKKSHHLSKIQHTMEKGKWKVHQKVSVDLTLRRNTFSKGSFFPRRVEKKVRKIEGPYFLDEWDLVFWVEFLWKGGERKKTRKRKDGGYRDCVCKNWGEAFVGLEFVCFFFLFLFLFLGFLFCVFLICFFVFRLGDVCPVTGCNVSFFFAPVEVHMWDLKKKKETKEREERERERKREREKERERERELVLC